MKNKSVRFLLIMALAVVFGGILCSVSSAEEAVAKVRVYRNGKMTLDGRQITLDQMRKGFPDLKKKNGVVWYFREAAEQEPHPNATLVVQAIIDAKLPVSMSNKEDFSTVVLPDGTIKPR
jgi:hypothetical protein